MGATFAKEDSAEHKLFTLITERVPERQLMSYINENKNYINFKSLDDEFHHWTFAFAALVNDFPDRTILYFISKFPESLGITGNVGGAKRTFMSQCTKTHKYYILYEVLSTYKITKEVLGDDGKFLFKLLRTGNQVPDNLQAMAVEKLAPFMSINQIHTEFPHDSQTLLLETISPERNSDVVMTVLKLGADPNLAVWTDSVCITPLIKAIHCGSSEILKMLISHGATLNTGNMKTSPFVYAIKHKKNEMLDILLKLGTNLREAEYESLLITSVLNNNIKAYSAIVSQQKYTEEKVSQILNKCFIDAIKNKNFYLVMLFLQVRFNPLQTKDSSGKTAWEYMKENGMSNLYLHDYEKLAHFDKNNHLTNERGAHYTEFIYEIDTSERLEDDPNNIMLITVTGDHILEKVFSRNKIMSLLHPENYMFSCPAVNTEGMSKIDNTEVFVRILMLGEYVHVPIKFLFKIINDKAERRYVLRYEKMLHHVVHWDDIDMATDHISYRCRTDSARVYNVYLTREPSSSARQDKTPDWGTEHLRLTW